MVRKEAQVVGHNPQRLVPPPDLQLQPETMEKMRQLLSETLDSENAVRPTNGERQFAREQWLFHHLRIVVSFHLEEDQAKKDLIWEEIKKSQEEGAGVGFNPEQIACLNFLILEERQKGQARLKNLLQKLDAKMAQAK